MVSLKTNPSLLPTAVFMAVLGLLLNAFVFGVSWWPFRQLQSLGLHPLWSTAVAFISVALCIAIFQRGVLRLWLVQRNLWLLALASGVTNVSFNWAVTVGDVVRVVLLFYLMPAWSLLFARWLLNEPITPKALLRLALAIGGVMLVLTTPESTWPLPHSLADYLAILGGASFAFTNVWIRKTLSQHTLAHATQKTSTFDRAQVFSLFVGTSITSVLVALAATQAGVIAPTPWTSLPLIASVGLVLFALAFWAGNTGMQYGAARLKASTSSLIMLSEILFATVSSALLGTAQLNGWVVAGGLLICAAAVWAALD